MSFLIACFIIISISAAYAILLKRKLAETVFLAVVSIVLILFCFGLLNIWGSLLYGIYFIIALTVLSVIFIVYKQCKDSETLKNIQIIKGCLLFTIFLAIALIINYGRVLHSWDEFSHWGTIVKHFFHADALGTVPHPNYDLFHERYLPGTSLFQYFFSRFSSQFNEYNLYIGMNMLYFSLIMPFVKDIFTKRKWAIQALILIALVMAPIVTNSRFYFVLYVDSILGAFFGVSILYYFTYKYEESTYGIFIVASSVIMLVMTKDMGLLLACGVVFIILIDLILFRRKNLREVLNQDRDRIVKTKSMLLIILPLLSVLFVSISWNILLAYSEIDTKSSTITLNEIIRFFTNELEPYQIKTKETLFSTIIGQSITNYSITFLVITLSFSFLFRKKYGFIRMITASIIMIIGYYAYQLILGILMAYVFPEREAVYLASYTRYLSTYILAMMYFMLAFFTMDQDQLSLSNIRKIVKDFIHKEIYSNKKKLRLALNIIVIAVVGLGLVYTLYKVVTVAARRVPIIIETTLPHVRNYEREIGVAIRKWMSYFKEDNPYLIHQRDTGLSLWMVRYELMPYAKLANIKTWTPERNQDYSISPESFYGEYDDFTFVVTPEEWEQHVLSREYILIYVWRKDDVLENYFGSFFIGGVQDDMLYKVYNDDGRLRLEPLTPFVN